MSRFIETIRDLRRRRVFRGCGVYLLGAWSLVQVADVLAEPIGLPAWTVDGLLIVALAGFPLAAWVAWRYQWTARGLVRTRRLHEADVDDDGEAPGPLRLGGVDYFVLAGLAVLAAYFGWSGIEARRLAADADVADAVVAAAERADAAEPAIPTRAPEDLPGNAVAVMPFDYLSADGEGAFLADGVSDTVLHVLSRVPDLQVTARTSSFAYRDRGLTAPQLAIALGVAHVLEGSVQRVGEQVRVIARLVDARSGGEVWSGRFDRDVASIFAIQDEIAQNVAAALQANISERSQEALASRYEPDLEAFEQYLLGRRALEMNRIEQIDAAVEHMERAVEIDPGYALAWVGLHDAVFARATSRPGVDQRAMLLQLEGYVKRALELDPLLAEAWIAQSMLFANRKQFADSKEALMRALELNPNLARAHAGLANLRQFEGDKEGRLEAIRQAVALDPEEVSYREREASALWALSRAEEAMSRVRALLREHPDRIANYNLLGRWYTQLGRAGEGMRYLQAARELDPRNPRLHKIVCEQFLQFWDRAGARDCFSEYLEANPQDLDARRWRLVHVAPPLADMEARLREAVMLAEQQIERMPDAWYVKLQLAEFLMRLDEYERTVDLLQQTFPALAGPDPRVTDLTQWAARLLGEALWKTGRRDVAQPLFTSVLEQIERTRKLQGGGWIAGIEDAQILCVRGEIERCLDRFADAVDGGWLFYSLNAAEATSFDTVRDDPRFEAIIDRLEAHAAREREYFYARRDEPLLPRGSAVAAGR